VIPSGSPLGPEPWPHATPPGPARRSALVDVRLDPAVAAQDPCGQQAGKTMPLLSAYFSKNDNETGDAEFNIAQPDWREVAEQCGQTPMDGCATPF